jgi:uncharacterized membrane protein YeaQ/YmgE (transglycosylase-associated protein family)
VIGAAILGVVAGFLGRALLPGKQEVSLVMTIVLGLAGALVGFLIFTELLGIGDTDAFDLGGLPGAVIGAMLLLFLYDRFVANRPDAAATSGAAAGAPGEPRARGRSQRGQAEPRSRQQREADAERRRERRNR